MHDDAESARADEAHEVDRLLSSEEGASSSCEPIAWRSAVEQAWWYRASPFAFCAAGGLLVLRPEPLERGLPLFPWRCTGLAIVVNGFASFMGDVETWGRPSNNGPPSPTWGLGLLWTAPGMALLPMLCFVLIGPVLPQSILHQPVKAPQADLALNYSKDAWRSEHNTTCIRQ